MSTSNLNAPFRYDIVGSFIRPENLKKARQQFNAGLIDGDDLKRLEDEAIAQLVQKAISAGLKGITDGEYRRSWWHLDFFWGLEGIVKQKVKEGYVFNGIITRAETANLSGRIAFKNHPFLQHFSYLKSLLPSGIVPRQTIPAPAQLYAELVRPDNLTSTHEVYPKEADLLQAIADAYGDAINSFYDLGCRNLQFDDCTWGMLCDADFREQTAKHGPSADELASIFLTLNNEVLKRKPNDLVINTHVCRGNYQSRWASSGGYEPVAPLLFKQENVDAFYLEFDSDRAGGFSPLRFIPDGKKVVLGLVTTKIPQLESKDFLKARIKEASAFVPFDNLFLSPQCGFASTEEGNLLTETDQWAKINLVKETALELWG